MCYLLHLVRFWGFTWRGIRSPTAPDSRAPQLSAVPCGLTSVRHRTRFRDILRRSSVPCNCSDLGSRSRAEGDKRTVRSRVRVIAVWSGFAVSVYELRVTSIYCRRLVSGGVPLPIRCPPAADLAGQGGQTPAVRRLVEAAPASEWPARGFRVWRDGSRRRPSSGRRWPGR
jgi:hypothetical protein